MTKQTWPSLSRKVHEVYVCKLAPCSVPRGDRRARGPDGSASPVCFASRLAKVGVYWIDLKSTQRTREPGGNETIEIFFSSFFISGPGHRRRRASVWTLAGQGAGSVALRGRGSPSACSLQGLRWCRGSCRSWFVHPTV